jgi:serine/threonine protein kinase
MGHVAHLPHTQAVHDIHERGVVHSDISPSNVVFTTGGAQDGEGSSVLIDFGNALTDRPRGAAWRQQSYWGTTGFRAPEVVECGKCSLVIDVWSAGAVIAFQVCWRSAVCVCVRD